MAFGFFGFVDDDVAAFAVGAVEGIDCGGETRVVHFDEREAARASGDAVVDEFSREYFAEWLEQLLNTFVGDAEGEVAYIY